MAAHMRCPICRAPAESLWRENEAAHEMPVCEVCNEVRMDLHEAIRERHRTAESLVNKRLAKHLEFTFFGTFSQ